MKIGIILICYNNEKYLNDKYFKGLSNLTKNIQLCFVNNMSNDNTLEQLETLKENFESKITIIDIKKSKDEETAIKAGVRYFKNTMNFKHIGYVHLKDFNDKLDLECLADIIQNNKDELIKFNLKAVKNKPFHRLLIKNVFSVLDYLKYLKIDFRTQKFKNIV